MDRHAWRSGGRALSALAVLTIGAIQLASGARGDGRGAVDIPTLALLGSIAAVYGAGAKLSDLTAEHGLRSRSWKAIAYTISVLGMVALMPLPAGATMVVAELAFHGVIKGKADNRAHVLGLAIVLPILVAAFALLSVARVDWTTVAIVLFGSLLWMFSNNRWLRLGDNLFHQVRGDMIVTFGILALIDPPRWLPFAVVIAAEHLAYALCKRIAMHLPWYRAGDEVALTDQDPLGVAFHATRQGPASRS